MQTKKAKYHLKRIETILNLHEDSLSSLDRDILLDDIRQLYDLILHAETGHPIRNSIARPDHTTIHTVIPTVQSPSGSTIDSPADEPKNTASLRDEQNSLPVNDNTEPSDSRSGHHLHTEDIRHTPTTVTYEESPGVPEPSYRTHTDGQSSAPEIMNGSMESGSTSPLEEKDPTDLLVDVEADYPELFEFTVSSDLSDKLANTKIERLNKILTINDKILFINHLYGGEAIPFQESLKKFEGFYTYEEATRFASRELVEKYQWTKADKLEIVRQFMQQVKRLYI